MIEVIPLKYGTMFKHAFSPVDVFTQFANDILDIDLHIDEVHTEYEYPEPIGFVKSKYDLFAEDKEQRIIVEIQQVKEPDFFDRFLYYHLISLAEQVKGYQAYQFDRTVYTIVLLTSVPRDGSIDFSCAVSDMNPIDEQGRKIGLYPHRLIFLCPRLVNDSTPPKVKKWLSFIEDSLDKKMDENQYSDDLLQGIIERIKKQTLNPELLAEIKDAAAWDIAKARFRQEGIEQGIEQGIELERKKSEQKLAAEKQKLAEEKQKRQQEQIILIKRLSQQGFDPATIATMLDISIETVNEVTGVKF